MLKEIYVENFALIEKAVLPFQPGFNVLTGETGAGKSIVIDAVSLLLGARASEHFIRTNSDTAIIQGTFMSPFWSFLITLLADNGIEIEDDLLILTREISRNGKSICRINMRTVNLSFFKQVGNILINIHGQKEHSLLLAEDNQLKLLDSFAGGKLLAVKKQVAAIFQQINQVNHLLLQYAQSVADRETRLDFLNFQLEEINRANLKIGEDQELEQEKSLLLYSENIASNMKDAYSLLNNQNTLDNLAKVVNYLKDTVSMDNTVNPYLEAVENSFYTLEDTAREIRTYLDNINNDPESLEQIDNRLVVIKTLNKKFGGTIAAVLNKKQEFTQEVETLTELEDITEEAQAKMERLKKEYAVKAQELTGLRQEAGLRLAHAITAELNFLCMADAQFFVELKPVPANENGMEKAVFLIQSNLGEPPLPVMKIASGGELSRIILGIKVILSRLDKVATLIFDEIDTGLGGRAINSVAQRLVFISQNAQCIAVTHSPVMAGAGNHHIYIYKESVNGRTQTKIKVLQREERVAELSRMIAGDNVTTATVNQAQELLNCCLQGKNCGS